jgi:DNA-binding LacI/PurR family transcriptional regulator
LVVAQGLTDCLRDGAGAAVPAGLAVIGVDDIPAARLAVPPLTTVTTDQTALATYLAATVVAAVGGHPAPALPVADLVRVVVRDST